MNNANGSGSVVSGGSSNIAWASGAVVAGGDNNTAASNHSSVSGGDTNTADASFSVVAGGHFNLAGGTESVIGGGAWNKVAAGTTANSSSGVAAADDADAGAADRTQQYQDQQHHHSQKPHIVTTSIEHPAILQYLKALHARGEIAPPTLVAVNSAGVVDLQALRAALRPTTALVSVMHSNNEIGTLQPVADVVRLVNAHNAARLRTDRRRTLVHTDAAQSCGKVILVVGSGRSSSGRHVGGGSVHALLSSQ